MLRKRLLMAILLGALAATTAWSQQKLQFARSDNKRPVSAKPGTHPAGIQYMRGPAQNGAASASPAAPNNPLNMTYYGGLLLPTTTTYVLVGYAIRLSFRCAAGDS